MSVDRAEIAASAAAVMRVCRTGALASLDAEGGPFSSFVAVAADGDGMPILLLSSLAAHTANLARDCRSSLLLVGEPPAADPLTVSRLSLVGEMHKVTGGSVEAVRTLYLAAHPEAEGYSRFRDFAFYRMTVRSAHFVAGFGRIAELSGDELRAALHTAPLR